MIGACNGNFFGPAPWGPGEGSKGQISFNFDYKVNFKDFLYQTVCLFSQIIDKHIRRDSNSVACVMPQRSDFGAPGCRGGQLFFKHGHVAYQIDGEDE